MPDVLPYSYRVLKFDLTAGLTDFEIAIDAERIDYVSPTDGPELQVRLQLKGNDQLPLRPNGSIEAPFTRFYLSASAVAKTVFLMVGAPAGVRVTGRDVAISGNINTRDFERFALETGALFSWGSVVQASLGNFGEFLLWNPSATKSVYLLEAIAQDATPAFNINFLYRVNSNAGWTALPNGSNSGDLNNSDLYASAPSAQLFFRVRAGTSGGGTDNLRYARQLTTQSAVFSGIWKIGQNEGLVIGGATANMNWITSGKFVEL